jgi:hypothetical protein
MHKHAAATALAIALSIMILTLTISASLTPANAGWNSYCEGRAGAPCVFRFLWFTYSIPARPAEIIERPHNGTAVLRADGSIYYSPNPGFTGRDSVKVIYARDSCQVPEKLQANPARRRAPHLTLR